MDMQTSFRSRLYDAGLLFPTGVDGLVGRNGVFEQVFTGLETAITRAGLADKPEVMRFPPAMSQKTFERSGYMKNFPHFAGTVHCFCGDDKDHHKLLGKMAKGEDWMDKQESADIVLSPAACYQVYPIVAQRGALQPGGHLVDVQSYCFRHEPSLEPTRMQLFRMREYVRIGTEAEVLAFRADWMERGQAFVDTLHLPYEVEVANDPFFGRAGKLMADSQRMQNLKFELLIPVNDGAGPTACLSFNYHQTYFGDTWGMVSADGSVAQTACCAFGMERLVLAMFRHHGFELAGWPAAVRQTLGFD
jgi:seryl-tRNA synthetase